MRNNTPPDLNQARTRILRYCAQSERAPSQVRNKMAQMGLPPTIANTLLEELQSNNLINPLRFAQAFIKDHIQINKWGQHKITHALQQLDIPNHIITQAYTHIQEQGITTDLLPILQRKQRTLPPLPPHKQRQRLHAFALQRGFSPQQIHTALQNLENTQQ